MTQTIKEYPVFEADQVLSQNHLNQLVGYLEEQDRLSRVYLHGMGIVCGLEVSKPNATTIHIHCGTAITSLGFLIPFEENKYTGFKETIISEDFLAADLSKHAYLGNIYQWTNEYAALNHCLELLPDDSDDEEGRPLTEEILKDKIVMLLLESPLIDEKNCVTIDCADKGKRLELNVRVLLVDSGLLNNLEFHLSSCKNDYLSTLRLPRYSVPQTNLITGDHVINAFHSVINRAKSSLSQAISLVHDHFQTSFGFLENYSRLQNANTIINNIHQQHNKSLFLQYVWDWLNDLAATYNEITAYHSCDLSICCPQQNNFPFHVLLGSAEFETESIKSNHELSDFRTHFIKSGVGSTEEKEKHDILKGLLQKLIYLLDSFQVDEEVNRTRRIRVTPSSIGGKPLSERAIPYYYSNIQKLNETWSPVLTQKLLNQTILSYNSEDYNSSDPQVNQPLLYDLEPFNFFRIEGHIGQHYAEAVTEIVALQQQHRLPFKVVALNAVDSVNKKIDISNQSDSWDDMELDYDLAKEKIYNVTEYVITWIKTNKNKIQKQYPLMTDQTITNLESILKESRDLLTEDLKDFLPLYESFYEVFEGLNDLFLSHRLCISFSNQKDMHPIMEDLVDHFDEINSLFLEDPFTVIYEEAQRRWENSMKELFLANFLEKHPGIHHEAGVIQGGTFILVYTDHSIFQDEKVVKDNSRLLDRIANYKDLFEFNEQQLNLLQKNNVVRKRAVLKGRVAKEPESKEWQAEKKEIRRKLEESISKDALKLPYASREFVEGQINQLFDRNFGRINIPSEVESDVPERVIIADFYLPYIYCSSGNNINIIITSENNTEPIVADFDHNDFNNEDFFTNNSNS